jgi:HEXXH motif-containing protein
MVCISDCQDIFLLGEMLVHEATHNYCSLASRLGSLTDCLHKELYHSPFLNAMRPLDAILVTYHAYANVYSFYRSCLGAAPDSRDVCVERMQVILGDLRVIEDSIIKNRDRLTPIGAALIDPLIRELRNEH